LSIGCNARLALLTALGVIARFTARPGCMTRRTLRGTNNLEKNPIYTPSGETAVLKGQSEWDCRVLPCLEKHQAGRGGSPPIQPAAADRAAGLVANVRSDRSPDSGWRVWVSTLAGSVLVPAACLRDHGVVAFPGSGLARPLAGGGPSHTPRQLGHPRPGVSMNRQRVPSDPPPGMDGKYGEGML
jgi:hypothetical protein